MRAALPLLLAAALGASALFATRAARAADPPPRVAVRLEYIRHPGAKSCPPEQALRDEVATRMGYDPFTPDAPDRIVATLSPSPHGLVATVERFDSKGSPQWDRKTYDPLHVPCAQLIRAMGVYISYRFLPLFEVPSAAPPSPSPPSQPPAAAAPPAASVPSTSPPNSSSPPSPPPRAPASPSPDRSSPAARPARAYRVELGLIPLAAFGFAPRPTFAGVLHLGLRWRSFSIAVEARADTPASASPDPLPSAIIGTIVAGGSVASCWHVAPIARWPRFSLMLGGVVTTAAVVGHSEGIPAPRKDVDIYVGTGPRAGVNLRLGSHLTASLYGDALASIKPARAVIGGMEVWRSSLVAGDVGGAILGVF